MATAYDLYENCETVISLIRERGFTKALLFKGFIEDEEKILNIVVYDNCVLPRRWTPFASMLDGGE